MALRVAQRVALRVAQKVALKAKTATKGPKSVKPMRETATKNKSKNAKDKSPEKNKSVADEFKVYNFKRSDGNLTSVLGCFGKVNFWFGKNRPCTQESLDLKEHIATFLPSLQLPSMYNAQQVDAFFAAGPMPSAPVQEMPPLCQLPECMKTRKRLAHLIRERHGPLVAPSS